MRKFNREQLLKARKTDLYKFLKNNHPGQVIDKNDFLRLKADKSVCVKQGYNGYKDFADDTVTGNSVDFLVNYLGYQLDEAVYALCSDTGQVITNENVVPESIIKLPPIFPEPVSTPSKAMYAYLRSRGITPETIKCVIDKGLVYQDVRNNVVFVNKERDWGEIRGTNSYAEARCTHRDECSSFEEEEHQWCKYRAKCERFKKDAFRGMVKNARKDGFWWLQVGAGEADVVYICEAAIDAISLYELHRLVGRKENAVYVSVGGAAKQQAIDRIKRKKRVIIAVDNDEAGAICRRRNSELESIIPKNKDWNDDLRQIIK